MAIISRSTLYCSKAAKIFRLFDISFGWAERMKVIGALLRLCGLIGVAVELFMLISSWESWLSAGACASPEMRTVDRGAGSWRTLLASMS
jgi:hypothetical protein